MKKTRSKKSRDTVPLNLANDVLYFLNSNSMKIFLKIVLLAGLSKNVCKN